MVALVSTSGPHRYEHIHGNRSGSYRICYESSYVLTYSNGYVCTVCDAQPDGYVHLDPDARALRVQDAGPAADAPGGEHVVADR